jgi:hypothetical protein
MTAANDLAVRRALELAGVEFIDENGGGSGCATARSSAAKKGQIVAPSSAVLCASILMRFVSQINLARVRRD